MPPKRLTFFGLLVAVCGFLIWKLDRENRSTSVVLEHASEPLPGIGDRGPWPDRANGFWLTNTLVPREEILSGGPSRDGIPSIEEPKFVTPDEAVELADDQLVIGVEFDGVARAYPLRILVWHEIVNDRIGTNSFCVTYCPLCASCLVFDRRSEDGRELEFGVSGLLYQSDMLMYDRQTESLWSQLRRGAVSGPLIGSSLRHLPAEHLTFGAWRRRHPEGQVLSTDTGFDRQYGYMPYASYVSSDELSFPVKQLRRDLRNKEMVAGVMVGGQAFALVPARLEDGKAAELVHNGQKLLVRYDAQGRHLEVLREGTRDRVAHAPAYWFAWQAFYPDTLVWPVE